MVGNTPNTSKRPSQSSDGDKTPESEAPHAKRAYIISPSLQAFNSFQESLTQFTIHIRTKMDHICNTGTEHSSVRTDLERMGEKCESMKEEFEGFISELDEAITNYEKKKPTDLPAGAEIKASNRSSSFKIESAHVDMFTALNTSLGNIELLIGKRIMKSIYDDQYSISLEKKLKKLKEMCEKKCKSLEKTGNKIKDVIKK